jgi:capsular exopolysaccharide synthesis family protein
MLSAAAIAVLPSRYVAEVRGLIGGPPPRSLSDEPTRDAVRRVIAELNPGSDPAFVAADRPAAWWRTLILLAGSLGGLGLGILVAASNRGAKGFWRADDVEAATNLPVMAMVPRLKTGSDAIADVLRDPISSYAASLRELSAGLQSADPAKSMGTVAITSAVCGEGRTTVVASLGRLLASEGKRVLLIDCNWRHPDLHRVFHVSNDTGLTSILLGGRVPLDAVIRTDALSGLDFITAGPQRLLASRMLYSDRMEHMLATSAKAYELVLLDMPSVLMEGEVLLLSNMVDKIMFAVRWRHTRRALSLSAIRQVVNSQGRVAGIVLTCVDVDRYRKYEAPRVC